MSYEVVVKPSIFHLREFSINADTLSYHDTEMDCKDITGFGYGILTTLINGVKTNSQYTINVIDSSGDEMKIQFMLTQYMDDNPDAVFARMVEESWKYFGQRILNETILDISKGGEWEIGGVTLNKSGLHYKYKPWFGKEKMISIEWPHIIFEVRDGILELKSSIDSDPSTLLNLTTYNVHVLAAILASTQRDADMMLVLQGKKEFQY